MIYLSHFCERSIMKPSLRSAANRDRLAREAWRHIRNAPHDVRSLARVLGVGAPTAARVVEDLRRFLTRRGMELRCVCVRRKWRYEIEDADWRRSAWADSRLLRHAGSARAWKAPGAKQLDDLLYGPRRR